MCWVFLVFPSWSVTPLSCHWAHWSEGWLCKEWINLCNWEYLYQQPLASHQLNKVTTGKKVRHAQATSQGSKWHKILSTKCCFETKHFGEKYHEKISWKIHPLHLLWQPLGDEMGAHRSCHYQDWPHVSKTSPEQKVPGCQCPVWSHFKMVQNIK